MIIKPIFYDDHDERYAHLSSTEKKEYPDEVILFFEGFELVLKRDMTVAEIAHAEGEEFRLRKLHYNYAARDIPLCKARPKEFK